MNTNPGSRARAVEPPLHRISIVIADDHPLFRKGLCDLIRETPRFRLLGEASNGEDAERMIRELRPDIAVLDVEMPRASGLDVARRLLESEPGIAVIILTMYTEESIFNRAIDAGVKGYILKDSATSDILLAIERVAGGEYYFSPTLVTKSIMLKRRDAGNREDSGLGALTQMEHQVLRLLSRSMSSREIAEVMSVSTRTVEHHRYNICQKLSLNGSFSLLRFALAHKGTLE